MGIISTKKEIGDELNDKHNCRKRPDSPFERLNAIVDEDGCAGCAKCAYTCPAGVITLKEAAEREETLV